MGTAVTTTRAGRPRNARGEGDRLRDDILSAAIDHLNVLGPEDAFSLRAVAERAGIAAPSIYRHFPDRDALLLAVLEGLFNDQIALREDAEAGAAAVGGGAWERLLARSVAGVRFGLEHPGHYRVMFEGRVALRLTEPMAADFGRPLMQRSAELILAIPNSRPDQDADPSRLALLLWASLHGIVSLRINKPTLDWPPAEDLAEQATRALIQPLLA